MAESAFPLTDRSPAGDFELREGEPCYRISDVDRLQPFLISLVGVSDVWVYLTSNQAVTAGRRNPNQAIFPYDTEDKLADGAGTTGCLTVIRGPWGTWRPWGAEADALGARRRSLVKTLLGDELVFIEERDDIGLSIHTSWRTSPRFGLIISTEIRNESHQDVDLDVLAGLINLLPAGATQQVQSQLSVLLDAYKRSEVDPDTGLGCFSLSSLLTDLAEPSEALTATTAWRLGPPVRTWLSDSGQLRAFSEGGALEPRTDSRGVRGAYLADQRVHLEAHGTLRWTLATDTGLDTAAALDLRHSLRDPDSIREALDRDLAESRSALRRLQAGADAVQCTGDGAASAHHVACVTFNAMRGGVPLNGYRVRSDDFLRFARRRNRHVADRAEQLLRDRGPELSVHELTAWGAESGDPDLERLSLEFLPLTFSRRHGDPSRPWNRFDIRLTDESGQPTIGFQGNWRDIFQNWEALAWSYPDLLPGMVTTFLNATTLDGYNPYRVSDQGIDWEVPEPDNPWSNIGYWSDHQVVYLTQLLELSHRFHPGEMESRLNRRVFTSADVPYRLAGFDDTVAHPSDTVTFDALADRAARLRAESVGGDGLLRWVDAERLHRSTLADKLLTLLAAKLVNFIPGGGIWMNTQRPEWNDANNALVGKGVSVVTTAQLLTFVRFLEQLLGGRDLVVRSDLADLLDELGGTLASRTPGVIADDTRRVFLTSLGRCGERYRRAVYQGISDRERSYPRDRVAALLARSAEWLEATLRENRRDDGLFHSYNLLRLSPDTASLERLPVMLEGQVAVLNSSLLPPDEALLLLRSLRQSALYRADQHSYLLYPDKDLSGFLGRNRLAERPHWRSLSALLADPRRPVVVQDAEGGLHFAPSARNARVLDARLRSLAAEAAYGDTLTHDIPAILASYEATFGHAGFTGRSGSFFAYEGLGSVYWHMVSKLVLAAQGVLEQAVTGASPADVQDGLRDAVADLRGGLGFAKSPASYGAFPTDPYSHTPRHTGARQPGMTGQVKEDIIARLHELGVRVRDGQLGFTPAAIAATDWLPTGRLVTTLAVDGTERTVSVPADALALTICQVPVVIHRDGPPELHLQRGDGSRTVVPGTWLSVPDSQHVFGREGSIVEIRVGGAAP